MRIHDLDSKHQQSLHEIDIVSKDEEARCLKLRVLTLRDENANLQDQLAQGKGGLTAIKKQNKELSKELAEAKKKERKLNTKLDKLEHKLKDLEVC